MTVENEKYTITHIANGVETEFTFDFIVYDTDSLYVYEDGALTSRSYTVANLGNKNGGSVTLDSPPSNNTEVKIEHDMPYTQLQVFQDGVDYPEPVIEESLDKNVILVQQVKRLVEAITDPARYEKRADFVDAQGATPLQVNVGDGAYLVKDKLAWWSNYVSVVLSTPSTDLWYYLYLDYSEITDGVELTADEFYWSASAPLWQPSLGGWYASNLDDRCIFAVKTESPATYFRTFKFDGNFVFVESPDSFSPQDIDTTGIDMYVDVPKFVDNARVIFQLDNNGEAGNIVYSYEYNSGISQLILENIIGINHGNQVNYVTLDVPVTGTVLAVEGKTDTSGTHTMALKTLGWYLPKGM